MSGALFENYIISEVLKGETHQKTHNELYDLRTSEGVEIDLIVDHKSYKECIEIKNTATFRPKMVRAVNSFLEAGDHGCMIYVGEDYQYSETINIINYNRFLSERFSQ